MAVRHTARRRPPFQPEHLAYSSGTKEELSLTLYCVPNEVEQDSLQQRNKASSQAPTIPILHGEANMPFQPGPGHECREESDEDSANHNNKHGLWYR
jgi:hypothetical protein